MSHFLYEIKLERVKLANHEKGSKDRCKVTKKRKRNDIEIYKEVDMYQSTDLK